MGIWNDVFGLRTSHNEIWSSVSIEINAKYSPATFFKSARIDYVKNDRVIKLDTYVESSDSIPRFYYTRMRSLFRNENNLRMGIYRNGTLTSWILTSWIGTWIDKILGMQKIKIESEYLSSAFVIRGSPEKKVSELINDEVIQSLIIDLSDQLKTNFIFKINNNGRIFNKYPSGVDELYFQCHGIIENRNILLGLFNLFEQASEKLEKIDQGCDFKINLYPK